LNKRWVEPDVRDNIVETLEEYKDTNEQRHVKNIVSLNKGFY